MSTKQQPQEDSFSHDSDRKDSIIAALAMQPSANFVRYYEKFMTVVGLMGQLLFYLQALKLYQLKSAHDLSLPGYLFALFSLMCWLFYGILKRDKVLIIVNFFAVIGAGLTVFLIICYS